MPRINVYIPTRDWPAVQRLQRLLQQSGKSFSGEALAALKDSKWWGVLQPKTRKK